MGGVDKTLDGVKRLQLGRRLLQMLLACQSGQIPSKSNKARNT